MTASASSSDTARGSIATALCVIVVFAYCVTLHFLITDGTLARTTLAFVLLPWLLATISICAKNRSHGTMIVVVLAVAIVVGFVVWRFGNALAARVDRVVYLENLAFDTFLALVFAITLRPGREALVTRLARTVRGGVMPDAIVPYTRAVTLAWAIYFVALAAISTVLFATQSRETWSLFVTVLVWPLTVAMFVVEYAVRLRVLRDLDHVSLLATMRAFMHRAS